MAKSTSDKPAKDTTPEAPKAPEYQQYPYAPAQQPYSPTQQAQGYAPQYAPQQPTYQTAAPVDTSPRSYLVIVTLAFFSSQTGLARWYRGENSGKIRFWVYVGCTVTSVIPFLNILSALGLLVLGVWGIIDFFRLHATTADANNIPYIASQRDISWAKVMKIVYTVTLCLVAAALLVGAIVALVQNL